MTDYSISKVTARQVIDSRANPTVEVDITLNCGAVGRVQSRPVPPPELMKLWNCGTQTKSTAGKVSARL